MPTRTSVELYPGGCRLVEVEVRAGRRKNAAAEEARVRAFVTSLAGLSSEAPASTGDDDAASLTSALRELQQRRRLAKEAWVTIWGLRSTHQFLRMPPATQADLESLAAREARKDIAPLETDGDVASVTVVMGGETQVGPHRRREVSLVAVSAAEVKRRIQPLVDAGLIVQGVLTPALALATIAREQRDILPESAVAYVALYGQATCLTIVRGGLLLFAREMPWGHQSVEGAEEGIGARLASELRRSVLFFKQTFRASVDGVVLCGDMPNLRGLTAPVSSAVAMPVKTLDSLTGIDAIAVPQPAEEFRRNVAALRLAIASGADGAPPANLLPAAIRTSRAARTQMVKLAGAVAASVIVTLGAYLMVQRSASAYEREREQINQEIARLEPEADRMNGMRQATAQALAQHEAIGAFETQGPRLARVLEVLSNATPEAVALSSIAVQAEGLSWRVTVTGLAVAGDAASGQAEVNALIARASASPFIGAPMRPPALRVLSGRGASTAEANTGAIVPPGMAGVEFVLQFQVAK
jgi:Tfp pilus assembly PilM family ATPase/Tfp pilus assembly protein PilN